VPVGAAPTCALIANGVSRRFSRFECKSEEKKTIARRRGGGSGARTFLRTGFRVLADGVEGDVVRAPPCSITILRLRTAPPSRDLHHGIVARVSYDFQSCFWRPKKSFWPSFPPRKHKFCQSERPFFKASGFAVIQGEWRTQDSPLDENAAEQGWSGNFHQDTSWESLVSRLYDEMGGRGGSHKSYKTFDHLTLI